MPVSRNTQATLLLTAQFSARSEARPLAEDEWARFLAWLTETGHRPADLLSGDRATLLGGWGDPDLEAARLEALLDRGSALAVALDRWLNAGLWIVTAADPPYPSRLSERLGRSCPPVLFGCGDETLLGRGGIAILGSRKAPAPDLEYAWHLGARVAESGRAVICGGGPGVEEEAVAGALESGGPVVGVLPGGLLSATAENRYRSHLMEGEMALVSPCPPEERARDRGAWHAGRIVCGLADAVVAVRTDGIGDALSGTKELRRSAGIPLWVRAGADPDRGGRSLGIAAADVDPAKLIDPPPLDPPNGEAPQTLPVAGADTLYREFLTQVRLLCEERPRTAADLSVALGLTTDQLTIWLSCAVAEGRLQLRPDGERYDLPRPSPGQLNLFDDC